MNEFKFSGKITEIREIRSGETEKGAWAGLEFEVTEERDQYPQVALFDYFKNGDYVQYARDFNSYFKVGDEVEVAFNLKKTTYQKKDGSGEGTFFKTAAWKVENISSTCNEEIAEGKKMDAKDIESEMPDTENELPW